LETDVRMGGAGICGMGSGVRAAGVGAFCITGLGRDRGRAWVGHMVALTGTVHRQGVVLAHLVCTGRLQASIHAMPLALRTFALLIDKSFFIVFASSCISTCSSISSA